MGTGLMVPGFQMSFIPDRGGGPSAAADGIRAYVFGLEGVSVSLKCFPAFRFEQGPAMDRDRAVSQPCRVHGSLFDAPAAGFFSSAQALDRKRW